MPIPLAAILVGLNPYAVEIFGLQFHPAVIMTEGCKYRNMNSL
jgi:anthranilate/para-aminobenzoate synthase component II